MEPIVRISHRRQQGKWDGLKKANNMLYDEALMSKVLAGLKAVGKEMSAEDALNYALGCLQEQLTTAHGQPTNDAQGEPYEVNPGDIEGTPAGDDGDASYNPNLFSRDDSNARALEREKQQEALNMHLDAPARQRKN